ncbi:condensation domain-containing protein [Streptomyces sp. NPDC001933]|uniref:condensation domain-containing protein n=1 Tax=Streptomyces sp. NPDC001933 TaxID=3364626 RepID=UPI003685473D
MSDGVLQSGLGGRRVRASHTQEERLLAGDGYIANNIIASALEFEGALDISALQRALVALACRHENLRSSFSVEGDAAWLEISDAVTDFFEVVDGGVRGFLERDAALALLSDRLQEPYDLEKGPLVRAVLVPVSEEHNVLGLGMDHIIADGRSREILLSDLEALYEAEVVGEAPDLPDISVQFADYASWERDYLQGKTLERLQAYWSKTLEGADPIPDAGLVDEQAPGGEPRGERLRVTIPADVKRSIEAVMREERVTMFGVVSAALKAAIFTHRSTEAATAPVAVFGSAANRLRKEHAKVFGYFATPIVFCTDLRGDPALSELIGRETRSVLGALRHQQLPHALVTKLVNPAQYGARHRQDQTGVPAYVNFDFGSAVPHIDSAADEARDERQEQRIGVRIRKVGLPVLPPPRGGLRILGTEQPDAIVIEVRYRADLYSKPWAEGFAHYLQRFLEAVATDAGMPLSAVKGA